MRAFRLAYDGRPFYGFQRQPTVPTVEGALFDALVDLSVLSPDADKPTGYAAAGRTDAGVSAAAQTVAFECPEWLTPRALNSELPATIRAWASADVPEDFHATHDATRREYVYHLYAPCVTDDNDGDCKDGDTDSIDDGDNDGDGTNGDTTDDNDTRPLDSRRRVDDDRVAAALDALAGRHDFHNLTPDETGTKRDLTTEFERDGDILELTFAAGGFARQLVRRLVAVVDAVGRGQQPLAWIETLLGPEPVDPRPPVASPEPLVLSRVEYPGVDFARDPEAATSGADAFGERVVDALVGYRVSAALVGRLAAAERDPEDKL